MEEIRNWLRGCGLDDYFEKFKENGWERFQDLETIGDKDLEDCIPLAGRRQRFRNEMGKKRQLTPRTSVRSDVMPTMDQREISPDETDFGHDDKCSMSW